MGETKEPEGWCYDCEKPLTRECVEGEHAYQEAVSEEEYKRMAVGFDE